MRALFLALALIFFTASLEGAIVLHGSGATFPAPLISKWAEEYKNGVEIEYTPIGSGGGVEQITKKLVDFGMSDAPLTPGERAKAQGILHIPVTLGGVVIAYNMPEAKEKLKLDGETIARIFSGQIRRWNDESIKRLNPDVAFPDEEIMVVHRLDSSGTTFVFTSYLSEVSEEWSEKYGRGKLINWFGGIPAKGNDGVSEVISSLPYSIGYLELTWAIETGLNHALIENSAGNFVEANATTIKGAASAVKLPMGDEDWSNVSMVNASGNLSYPVSSFSYMLVYRDQRNGDSGKALVDFIWWVIHEGQSYAEALHYVPLPDEVVKRNEESVKLIRYSFRE
ncbi:MAG: phosphate ABC transporter substrate-binding protein PstS [Candidatus Thermoplasmatota archaeon]|nr:phosphate ABC transporter substrate-binding protein PstS [Candidatus Thermoplasmatota archaeon]